MCPYHVNTYVGVRESSIRHEVIIPLLPILTRHLALCHPLSFTRDWEAKIICIFVRAGTEKKPSWRPWRKDAQQIYISYNTWWHDMYGMCSSTAVGLGRADKITIKILTAAMTLGRDFLHFCKGRTFQGPSHQRPVGRTGLSPLFGIWVEKCLWFR